MWRKGRLARILAGNSTLEELWFFCVFIQRVKRNLIRELVAHIKGVKRVSICKFTLIPVGDFEDHSVVF